jgi:hypothetical protein
MKSFRQYISEDLDDIQSYEYPGKKIKVIRGLINPSREELSAFVKKVGTARFILHNNQLHVWNAMEAIHDDVLRAEHSSVKGNTFLDKKNALYDTKESLMGSFNETFFSSPHQDPHGYHVGISYYEPEMKKWSENLLRNHSRTSHLIVPQTRILPKDT